MEEQGQEFSEEASRRFVERIRPSDFFVGLIGHIPGVNFFLKDMEGRIVHCDEGFVDMLGRRDRGEVLGRRDPEFFPPHIADVFMRGDELVRQTGEPLLDQYELVAREDFRFEWYVTHKHPVHDATDRVIGVAGINALVKASDAGPFAGGRLDRVMEHIRLHYGEAVPVSDLVHLSGMSRRSFERLFREKLGCSPSVYLRRVRVNAVCRSLIDPELSLAEIASACGFADQSHMTREFRRLVGVTPRAYRLQRSSK